LFLFYGDQPHHTAALRLGHHAIATRSSFFTAASSAEACRAVDVALAIDKFIA
jgi:hypothetical protein